MTEDIMASFNAFVYTPKQIFATATWPKKIQLLLSDRTWVQRNRDSTTDYKIGCSWRFDSVRPVKHLLV